MDNNTAEFRPSASLRWLLAAAALICVPVVFYEMWLWVTSGDQRGIVGGLLFWLPVILALAAWRRRVVVRDDVLRSDTLIGRRYIPWTRIQRVDQTRSSFTVETELGPVSAGWIAASERERLLKLVIERANLRPSSHEPRYGLIARYVPRSEEVRFLPHHARRRDPEQQK